MKDLSTLIKEKSWYGKRLKFDEKHEYLSNGFVMVPNDFLKTDTLTSNEKMVFICLLSFAFRGESCFPSLTILKKMTMLTKPTLIKSIKILEVKGFLKVEKTVGSNNTYILDFTHLNHLNVLDTNGGYKGVI